MVEEVVGRTELSSRRVDVSVGMDEMASSQSRAVVHLDRRVEQSVNRDVREGRRDGRAVVHSSPNRNFGTARKKCPYRCTMQAGQQYDFSGTAVQQTWQTIINVCTCVRGVCVFYFLFRIRIRNVLYLYCCTTVPIIEIEYIEYRFLDGTALWYSAKSWCTSRTNRAGG